MTSNSKNQSNNHIDYDINKYSNVTKDKRDELVEAENAVKYKEHFVKNVKRFMDQQSVNDYNETDKEYEHIIENIKTYFPKLPDSLLFFISAALYRGDCGRSATDRPLWLDMDMFRRGQKFIREHILSVFFANMLSLFTIFAFTDGLKPMILSRQSHTPYLAFKRYLSTICRVRNWMTEDPWTEGTQAHKDIQAVRRMHRAIRLKLCEYDHEELDAATKIPNPWCPDRKVILKDFSSCPYPTVENGCLHLLIRPTGLNQADMAATQFAFMGLILLYPHELGIHVSDEDMIAFCHVWRGIGYLLGIEDEYNFCRGNLEEIRQRARDFIEIWVKPYLRQITPEWEHMTRCVIEGINYYSFFSIAFNQALLFIVDLLNINIPHMQSTLTYIQRLRLLLLCTVFRYVMKIQFLRKCINKIVLEKNIDKATKFNRKKHEELKKRSDQKVSDSFSDP